MGGQACVLYGAAEFSKDFDFILLLEQQNLQHFDRLIAELEADVIAVPPFELSYLEQGHAVHFRAHAPGFQQVRIDIMCKLRGVDPFPALWSRRSTAELLPGLEVNILSLPDLVKAKKTQRDKDWPMIRRLVDVEYFRLRASATDEQIRFFLRELRTPSLLIECARNWPIIAQEVIAERSDVLVAATQANDSELEQALSNEEKKIRDEDKRYWAPLIKELETLRHKKRSESST